MAKTRPAPFGTSWRGLAVALAAVLMLTACGSTAQQETATVRGGEDFGVPATVDPLTGSPVVPVDDMGDEHLSSGGTATPGSGSANSAAGGAPAGEASSTGTSLAGPTVAGSSPRAGRLPGNHRAVTDEVVKIGFLYLESAGTVLGAMGVQGYSQGDELGVFRALVRDQNAKGGVGGRRLEVVPRDLGGLDESSYQAACTYFTQDSPVFMVFSALAHIELLNECLAKSSVGYTSNYIAPPDRLMRGLGPIYAPDDIGAERYAALLGRALVNAGFLSPSAKVGIIRRDTRDYERITNEVLRPILTQARVEVVAEETYNAADFSGTVAGAPAVTFRLRQRGVTHVISYETPLFYMTAAESQEWRPFWAITSRSAPGAFLEGAAPREQLKKAAGPGWQPVSDVATSRLTGPINSEEARCLATAKKAGYSYSGTPRLVLQMLCGQLYHFVRVIAESSEVSTAGFRRAAEGLAPYPSALTFSISFSGGRHDGAAAYRMVSWQETCGCFGYSSPVTPMPAS